MGMQQNPASAPVGSGGVRVEEAFFSRHNVRILGALQAGAAGSWLRMPARACDQIALAIEAAPPRALDEARSGRCAGIRVAAGEPAEGGRALLSGPCDLLESLCEAWDALDAACSVLAAAVRQARTGYFRALAPSGPPLIVGIVNVTPDSFSDGGRFLDPASATAHGVRLAAEGADWLDAGGESTRPGAEEVRAAEELRRVLPVVEGLARESPARISIDTRKASVARACVAAGATVINDVSALTWDPGMAPAAAEAGTDVVLMHMPGEPRSMQEQTDYEDVVADTCRALRCRAEAAVRAGIAAERLWIDPGFGFGKTVEQNLSMLRRLREYTSIGLPLFVGTSRKSTIGAVLGGLPSGERLEGTAATVAAAVLNGAAAVRVHDVREMSRVARMAAAIRYHAD